MRRIILGLLVCMALLASVIPAQATIWCPTESGRIDINFLNFTGETIALFDDSDFTSTSDYYLQLNSYDTIYFSQSDSDWNLSRDQVSTLFTLSGSDNFILALSSDSGWLENTGFAKMASGVYDISWNSSPTVTITGIDIQPAVPVPATLLLLGTGLFGLLGWRRRR